MLAINCLLSVWSLFFFFTYFLFPVMASLHISVCNVKQIPSQSLVSTFMSKKDLITATDIWSNCITQNSCKMRRESKIGLEIKVVSDQFAFNLHLLIYSLKWYNKQFICSALCLPKAIWGHFFTISETPLCQFHTIARSHHKMAGKPSVRHLHIGGIILSEFCICKERRWLIRLYRVLMEKNYS